MVDLDSARKDSKWVCPNDRGLALLAKVGAGWSVKTQHNQTYRQQSVALDETEQQIILEVIRRAEALESIEQERVGRLVDRLDNMKRNAIGSGTNQCILCGAQCVLFGVITTSSIVCRDCKKMVCQKCGVESYSGSRKEVVWRCKICSETREMWKKSGAWFFKAIPKHVLPVKKPPENKFLYGSRAGFDKKNWSRASNMRSLEAEEESSSDEERASRLLSSRSKRNDEPVNQSQSSLWQVSPVEKRSPGARSVDLTAEVPSIDDRSVGSKVVIGGSRRGMPTPYRRETSESSESGSSTSQTVNHHTLTHSSDSAASRSPRMNNGATEDFNYSPSFLSHRQNSQLSLLTSQGWYSDSDRFSLSGSSLNGQKCSLNIPDEPIEQTTSLDANLGLLELTLVYDSVASSIHVSLHRAKNLKPMDINGLSDPFCKLNLLPLGIKSHRLRTRTVHKTRNPEFNETLTFYGVTENDLAVRALHVLVLDDDKYGHDFMGEARYPLDRLRPDVARQLTLFLEKHYPVENEEEVWGEEGWTHGQILITLCYSTKRKALIVGIIRCTNLLPMDSNGFSDPFVKLYLKPDHYHRKYKTNVKWKSLNPVFNEEFVFETKMTDLPQQTLVLTVWDKDYGKSNDYLGCLELGCKSKGERLRQWVDMIKFPDHKHEGWHNLCEDPPPS
ncbi:rabphilin-3A isoform X2 [Macrosteles quadrilineatus]|uniref:rabphilin-3A isoform X2 n=1 Tax=Macrosteles quadrilineatus TaxID=74068 RepID=UPI0023E2D555|nr:rabphilin-3A isoform X2 [Macrosteles quadrilineatus]